MGCVGAIQLDVLNGVNYKGFDIFDLAQDYL